MKKILFACCLLLLPILLTPAADVRLSFDDTVNPPGSVQDYRIIRVSGTDNTNRVTLAIVMYTGAQTNIQTTVTIPVGTNTLVATAVGTNGLTSADSEPLTVIVPDRPTDLRLPAIVTPE